jgi:hypothetical protein
VRHLIAAACGRRSIAALALLPRGAQVRKRGNGRSGGQGNRPTNLLDLHSVLPHASGFAIIRSRYRRRKIQTMCPAGTVTFLFSDIGARRARHRSGCGRAALAARTRIVTLAGPGGTGKTPLARETATAEDHIANRFA